MVVFIDESYQRDSSGVWHYALAGFGINEFRYRALQAAVYQLCLQTFDRKENYGDDLWKQALDEKIIVEREASSMELKAEFLLKSANLRRFGGDQSPHYQLASKVLTKVHECRGTTVGVLLNPSHPNEIKDTRDGCPQAYQRLIELVGNWMLEEHEGQAVTLVMDTEHVGVNQPLSRAMAAFMYRSATGKRLKHVFPAPFWIDSESMVGPQVADLVAHVLMNSMKPPVEQKPLYGLTAQVFGTSYRWLGKPGGTISRMRRKTTADEG